MKLTEICVDEMSGLITEVTVEGGDRGKPNEDYKERLKGGGVGWEPSKVCLCPCMSARAG